MATVLGSLLVSLSMDSANFERGTREAQGALSRLKSFSVAATAAITATAVAAAGSLLKMGMDAVQMADDVYMASIRIGIGTEELSRLKYAAEQSDVTFEQLQTSVLRLSRGMVDASNGTGTAGKAFEAMGISVENADGTMKSATQIIEEIANQFAAMPDGVEKAALAMQIFGRAGATMIPLLNEGGAGIRALTEEAGRLGIVITEETGAAAEEFNDNLARVQTMVAGVGVTIAADLLPYLLRFSDWLTANQSRIRNFTTALAQLSSSTVSFIASVARATEREINAISRAYGRLAEFDRDFSRRALLMAQGRGAMAFLPQAREATGVNMFSQALGAARDVADQFQSAARTVSSVALPEIETAATGVAGAARSMASGVTAADDALAELERQAAETQQVLDRLFPDQARARQFAADMQSLAGATEAQRRALMNEYDMANEPVKPEIDWGIQEIAPDLRDIQDQIRIVTDPAPLTRFQEAARSAFGELSYQLTGALTGAQSLFDALKNVVAQLAQMALSKVFSSLAVSIGIPGYAGGTNFHPGGLAMVGEKGPELVNMPRGTQVVPNNQLSGMGQGASPTFNITVNGGMSDDAARRTGAQIGSSAARQMALARRTGLAG